MNNPNEERERLLRDWDAVPANCSLIQWAGRALEYLHSADAKRIAELEGCVAALRKDAERYRYARGRLSIGEQIVGWDKEPRFVQWSDAEIDAAINSASDTPMTGKEKA